MAGGHGRLGRVFHHIFQPGLLGVVFDITEESMQVSFVTNDAVEIFLLPDGSIDAPRFVDLMRGEAFPAVDDFGEILAVTEAEKNVHVIGHNDERDDFVAVAVEVAQSVGDDKGEGRIEENAGPASAIEFGLDTVGEEMVVFGEICVVERLRAAGAPRFRLELPTTDEVGGKAVGETPSDEVVFGVLLPVREIALVDGDFLERREEG